MLKNEIRSVELLKNVDFEADQDYIRVVDLASYPCPQSKFALEVTGGTGSGDIDVVYLVSIDGVTYFAPTDTAVISTVTTSAKRANVVPFSPTFCRFLKFTFSETASEAHTGVSATLIMM